MSRYRKRDTEFTERRVTPFGTFQLRYNVLDSYILDNKNPRPYPKSWSETHHYQTLTRANGGIEYPGGSSFLSGWTGMERVGTIQSLLNEVYSEQQYVPLEFQENNSFELIPALFDLDGTIAMFTRKFWREINYGAVNWGLLPFISDVKSLINTCRDILENRIERDLSAKRRELARSFNKERSGVSVSGSFHMDGQISINQPDLSPEHTAMYLLLDELGVHPDLKTVWDIIPLSFVADYFLPVGDYLEKIHPRGWYRPTVTFTGGYSLKGEADCYPYNWYSKDEYKGNSSKVKFYIRGTGSFTGSTRPNVTPQWSAPNARQLFNTAYLSRAKFH